jgi:hypothetical protein
MNGVLKGRVRNGRVEGDVPFDLPEGMEVTVSPRSHEDDDGPMSDAEIAYVLAAMKKVQPLDISAEEAADLDAWEAKINRYGMEKGDCGIEHVFR